MKLALLSGDCRLRHRLTAGGGVDIIVDSQTSFNWFGLCFEQLANFTLLTSFVLTVWAFERAVLPRDPLWVRFLPSSLRTIRVHVPQPFALWMRQTETATIPEKLCERFPQLTTLHLESSVAELDVLPILDTLAMQTFMQHLPSSLTSLIVPHWLDRVINPQLLVPPPSVLRNLHYLEWPLNLDQMSFDALSQANTTNNLPSRSISTSILSGEVSDSASSTPETDEEFFLGQLVSLSLYHRNLTPGMLHLRHMTNLEQLELHGYIAPAQDGWGQLMPPNLTSLTLGLFSTAVDLQHLPHLTKLTVNSSGVGPLPIDSLPAHLTALDVRTPVGLEGKAPLPPSLARLVFRGYGDFLSSHWAQSVAHHTALRSLVAPRIILPAAPSTNSPQGDARALPRLLALPPSLTHLRVMEEFLSPDLLLQFPPSLTSFVGKIKCGLEHVACFETLTHWTTDNIRQCLLQRYLPRVLLHNFDVATVFDDPFKEHFSAHRNDLVEVANTHMLTPCAGLHASLDMSKHSPFLPKSLTKFVSDVSACILVRELPPRLTELSLPNGTLSVTNNLFDEPEIPSLPPTLRSLTAAVTRVIAHPNLDEMLEPPIYSPLLEKLHLTELSAEAIPFVFQHIPPTVTDLLLGSKPKSSLVLLELDDKWLPRLRRLRLLYCSILLEQATNRFNSLELLSASLIYLDASRLPRWDGVKSISSFDLYRAAICFVPLHLRHNDSNVCPLWDVSQVQCLPQSLTAVSIHYDSEYDFPRKVHASRPPSLPGLATFHFKTNNLPFPIQLLPPTLTHLTLSGPITMDELALLPHTLVYLVLDFRPYFHTDEVALTLPPRLETLSIEGVDVASSALASLPPTLKTLFYRPAQRPIHWSVLQHLPASITSIAAIGLRESTPQPWEALKALLPALVSLTTNTGSYIRKLSS